MCTDQLLQEAVKKSFPGGTIVSIAHRLDTIIDYVVMLELGAGKVLEFGSPHNLIKKKDLFAKVAKDTAVEMSDELCSRILADSK
jgi:ABC-type multidrug transport system fused ATPase/permease subunit